MVGDLKTIYLQFDILSFFLWKPTSFDTITESDYTKSDKTFDHNRNWQSLPNISGWFALADQTRPVTRSGLRVCLLGTGYYHEILDVTVVAHAACL